jgi:hypothetical protein
MRLWLCKGTQRGWQGLPAEAVLGCLRLWMAMLARLGQELAFATVVLPTDPLQVEIFNSACRRVNTSLLPRAVRGKEDEISIFSDHVSNLGSNELLANMFGTSR